MSLAIGFMHRFTAAQVTRTIKEMTESLHARYVRACSANERAVLQAALCAAQRTGTDTFTQQLLADAYMDWCHSQGILAVCRLHIMLL